MVMSTLDRIKKNSLLPSEKLQLEHTIKLARKNDYRNSMMIETMYRTGFRATELLSINKKSLVVSVDELEDGTRIEAKAIRIKTLKRNKRKRDPKTGELLPIRRPKVIYREVVVSDEFWSRLSEYALTCETDLLFPIKYDRLDDIWKQYSPRKGLTTHALRHTYAKNHYLKSKDLQAIQQDLGHANIASTMVYAVVETPLSERKRFAV